MERTRGDRRRCRASDSDHTPLHGSHAADPTQPRAATPGTPGAAELPSDGPDSHHAGTAAYATAVHAGAAESDPATAPHSHPTAGARTAAEHTLPARLRLVVERELLRVCPGPGPDRAADPGATAGTADTALWGVRSEPAQVWI